MRNSWMMILAVLLGALGAGGCAYGEQRWADFAQVFRADVGVGQGLGVHAAVTEYGHVGLGVYDATAAGWAATDAKIDPYKPVQTGSFDKKRTMACLLLWKTDNLRAVPNLAGTDKPDRPYAIGADLFLMVVGIEFSIEPVELADFLLGVFGQDLLEDDRPPAEPDTAESYPPGGPEARVEPDDWDSTNPFP